MTRRLPGTPRALDAALALAVVVVLSVVVTADQANSGPVLVPHPLAYVWATGLGLLMLIRRQQPVLVLVLTTVGFFTYYAAGFPSIGVAVPIAAALFSAAEQRRVAAACATLGLVLVASTSFRLASGQDPAFLLGYELVGHLSLGASVIALGYSVRVRRDLVESRAGVARLVAAQTAAEAGWRAREERLDLARELHDSIGHSLAVASLFSDVARENVADDPERAATAVGQVKTSVSEALDHLRSTVSLLRASTSSARAVPGLDRLDELLDAPASAGFEVACRVDSDLDLDEATGETVFRIVQEAVTNTLKHSTSDRLEVGVVSAGPDLVEVWVVDEVASEGTAGSSAAVPVGVRGFRDGHGLAGMQERVAAAGGELAVLRHHRGWAVRSVLPVRAPS